MMWQFSQLPYHCFFFLTVCCAMPVFDCWVCLHEMQVDCIRRKPLIKLQWRFYDLKNRFSVFLGLNFCNTTYLLLLLPLHFLHIFNDLVSQAVFKRRMEKEKWKYFHSRQTVCSKQNQETLLLCDRDTLTCQQHILVSQHHLMHFFPLCSGIPQEALQTIKIEKYAQVMVEEHWF